jgi:catechol 2,3-dioxygenase-like lactoylglutathione lyase family enzyme
MSQAIVDNIIQIGIVVSDVDEAVANYRDLLGVRRWHVNYVDTVNGKGSHFHKHGNPIEARARIAWTDIGNVELELIEPQDEHSLYAEFLRDKGPGIHHVMFGTPDYDRCIEHFATNDIAAMGGGELQRTRFQMFDTRKILGVICEIADGDPLIPDESM